MSVALRLSAVILPVAFAAVGVGTDLLVAPQAPSQQRCAAGSPIAFVGVDALTMLDSVPRRTTLLVRDGKIAAIGNPAIPSNACRVDGAGMTLMPGLIDMHVHTDESEMPLFLANGVTMVRELNGSPAHIALQQKLARGEVIGPKLHVGSPLMTGKKLQYRHNLITTPDEAFVAAHDAKNLGYESIKIYDDLSLESYNAFVEAGKTLGLPLDGHIPQAVGLQRVLEAGQSIQHMDKIVFALRGHDDDAQVITAAKALFAGKRTWVTPTLASLRAMDIAGTAEYAGRFRQPEMAYVDTGTIGWWRSMINGGNRAYTPSRFYRMESQLLPALRSVGVRFLLGTDAANPLMIAGYSVHEELETLVRDGGFTPFEALLSATRNVGEFYGNADIGVLRVGASADLILVQGSPLKQLSVLERPAKVVVGGRMYSREELDEALRKAVKSTPSM